MIHVTGYWVIADKPRVGHLPEIFRCTLWEKLCVGSKPTAGLILAYLRRLSSPLWNSTQLYTNTLSSDANSTLWVVPSVCYRCSSAGDSSRWNIGLSVKQQVRGQPPQSPKWSRTLYWASQLVVSTEQIRKTVEILGGFCSYSCCANVQRYDTLVPLEQCDS